MDDPKMDHEDRLRQNLKVLNVARLGSIKSLEEFGTLVDKKFPVLAISKRRLLHIFISWLYDRLVDIDLSDQNAARDEIRNWLAYIRGCHVGDHFLADNFKEWEAEHIKLDPTSSRRLRFAWIELHQMLDLERLERYEDEPIQISVCKEINDQCPSPSSHASSASHYSPTLDNVDKTAPSSEVDDGGNDLYFIDTAGRSRKPSSEPATRPGESTSGNDHWGAIHPDRLNRSRQEAEDSSDPSGREDPEPSADAQSFLTGANQLAPGVKGTAHTNAQQRTVQHIRSGKNKKPQKSMCKRCERPGHQIADCPTSLDPRYDVSPGEPYVCIYCNEPGHYATVCRKNTSEHSINQRRIRAGIIQESSADSGIHSPDSIRHRDSRRRDKRTRDHGDRYTRHHSPPGVGEPQPARESARDDYRRSYRSRSPLGDSSRSRGSLRGGRDRYRPRSPGYIEYTPRYDNAEEHSREREPRGYRDPRDHRADYGHRDNRDHRTDHDHREPREPDDHRGPREPDDHRDRREPRDHRESRVPRGPREARSRGTNPQTTAPALQGILRQTVNKTDAENRAHKVKPIDKEANSKTTTPTLKGILRQPVNDENRPYGGTSRSVPTKNPHRLVRWGGFVRADESRDAADLTREEFGTGLDKPFDAADVNPKKFDTSLDNSVAATDLSPEDFSFALDELIADARDSAQPDGGMSDWDKKGDKMFSSLSLNSPIPKRAVPAPAPAKTYHPMILELFRNRPNPILHKVQRSRAKDFFGSTTEADLSEKGTVLDMDIELNTDLDVDPAVDAHQADSHQADVHQADVHQASVQEQVDVHQADVHQADVHQADVHQADAHQASVQEQVDVHQAEVQLANVVHIPTLAVDSEKMDEEADTGAAIEAGDDSFTENGDSVMEDADSPQLDKVE